MRISKRAATFIQVTSWLQTIRSHLPSNTQLHCRQNSDIRMFFRWGGRFEYGREAWRTADRPGPLETNMAWGRARLRGQR
ncbi:hypothetical protein FIBSPDRAFT_469468 [Athelia psychrophila]|uniref:Uncharacterized protein n=1 Tax=Athelia psychrophila TaxID=1759441 RepID=A0A166LGS2_9AGAM|nr:hypothetical protein FIBSPDRAFT_469468 [Fibularhizoctonia sp. CBS 109695]